ncbi:MAG: peptidylprolyl isomerase [Geminicoccaceae bacterium]
MRRIALATTALAVLFLAAPARAETPDPVVAIVNGNEIHKSDLEAAYEALPEQYRQGPIEAIYDPLLDQVVVSQLVLAAAEKKGLANDPEIQAMIARARDNVLRDGYVKQAIDQGTTDEKLRAAYDTMKSQPGFAIEETHAAHILVADEAEANAIIKQLQEGADFATLAKEKSTDPSAKTNGGDLGFFKRDAMVPEFAEAAFTIEPGTVGATPVKSQFGWHVIKVEERRETVPTFEEKEPELRQQVAHEIVTALLTDVRSGATIELFNLDGTPKPAK